MTNLTRQQLCAELGISESTVRRLELAGLPYTPVGVRAKRYDVAEVKDWLRENSGCPFGKIQRADSMSAFRSAGAGFTDACRKVQLRVMPSS